MAPIGAARAGFRMPLGQDPLNLVWDIPQWAWDLWKSQPTDWLAEYPTQDVTSYAGENGDLATAIEDASSNGNVADLGDSNTYVIQSSATAPGSVFGLIGTNCTINYRQNDVAILLNPTCADGVVKGVEFVYDESQDADAGLLVGDFSNSFRAKDVTLTGERNHAASTATSPTKYTWRPHMTQSGAEGICENVNLPDGDYYSGSGSPTDSERTIGFSTDPEHDGRMAFKDCYGAHWLGNVFYLSHSGVGTDGDSLLWNCEAYNFNRAGFRLGINDKAVGGKVEVQNNPADLQGQGIVFDQETNDSTQPTEAIGVEVTGNDFSAEAIVARNHQYSAEAWVRLDRVILDTNTPNRPVRFSEDDNNDMILNVELEDCYFYYNLSDTTNNLLNIWSGDVVVPEGNLYIESTDSDEIDLDAAGSLEIDGTDISSGTHTADELGLESPLGDDGQLPTTYFDYSVRD